MKSENRITARWVCPGGAKLAFSEPEISREPRKASAWPWPALLDKILLLSFCPHKADHHIQENKLKTGKVKTRLKQQREMSPKIITVPFKNVVV